MKFEKEPEFVITGAVHWRRFTPTESPIEIVEEDMRLLFTFWNRKTNEEIVLGPYENEREAFAAFEKSYGFKPQQYQKVETYDVDSDDMLAIMSGRMKR